jgi:predicted GTPase
MLTASRPVIAVSGLRTGCGKSPISRWLARYLRDLGRQVAVIRHPMPYGNLAMEKLQSFASLADLDAGH